MAAVLDAPEAAKAATLTPNGELAYFSFPIEKVEDAGDGEVVVYGKATDGSLDSDLQIVDPEWSAKALQEWYDTGGNVRVQHQAQRDPAGRGIEVKGHAVRVRVVEPVAVKLVKAGVLQDFSVGIMNPDLVLPRDPRQRDFRHLDPAGKAVNGILTGRADGMSKIGELSLVDRGSNFGTKFALLKAAADGSAQWAGELTAPDEVIAKVTTPGVYKTVSVELPANMRLKISPAQLAKMNTLARRNAVPVPAVAKVADPDAEKAAADDLDAAYKLAEADAYKRDIDTAARRRLASQGRALSDLSYPIETHEDASNAVTLALSGHGNVSGAKALIRRIARKEGWQDILDRLKGKKKPQKAAAPDAVKDDDEDKLGQCPSCKGRGYVKKPANMQCEACGGSGRASGKTAGPGAVKKKKVMCASCGARQNRKHNNCSECGKPLAGAIPIMKKNHDYTCLKCGKDLDKGEKFCPNCGKENPGYLPEADHKIPANKTTKERVSVTKARKSKKDKPQVAAPDVAKDDDDDDARKASAIKARKGGKGKKGKNPFGGNKAKPFGAKPDGDGDADDDGDAKKSARAQKRRKGGKKGGKGRSPAIGAVSQDTAGLPPHREPVPPAVDAFEQDAEMKAAMRLRTLGIDYALGALHDMTCPAFKASDVARAFPNVSFDQIDTEMWQRKALDAAAGSDIHLAMQQYNEMAALSQAAVFLKTADPEILADVRAEQHKAFLKANKTFADATPGPGSYPTPSHPMPGQFRRPYLSAGHQAPSPQFEGPRSFGVPQGQLTATDYARGYITEGRAADAPANPTARHEPAPQPMTGGQPENVRYDGMMRDNARSAVSTMHDHISRIFPGACPMSPPVGEGQHPVPAAEGGPVPRTGKAAKPKATKAQRQAAAAKRAAQVAKRRAAAAQKTAKAEVRKAAKAAATVAETPPAPVPVIDEFTITKSVAAATRPLAKRLVKRLREQDKQIRRLTKTADAIAGQRDTRGAPFRGAGVAKSASAALAGPLTPAMAAEQAQAGHIQRLHSEWRNSPNPETREAAWAELTTRYGINPLTGPSTQRPSL